MTLSPFIFNLLAAGEGGATFYLPPRASETASGIDGLFNFIMGLSIFFFFLITIVATVFVIRYRHKPGREMGPPSSSHNTALEMTWTIIPTILVIIIFYFGFKIYLSNSVMPNNAEIIGVDGKQFAWTFTYSNHVISPGELHVPLGRPIIFELTSQDVIHSFFVPAFRIHKDVVPGRVNKVWVTATQTGTFPLVCSQYCGLKHSAMLATVHVDDEETYNRWLAEQIDIQNNVRNHYAQPSQAGFDLFKKNNCGQCHTIDGKDSTGPTFYHAYGEKIELEDGTSVVMDHNWIYECIRHPNQRPIKGRPHTMPPFTFNDDQLLGVATYIESLGAHYQGDKGWPPKATTGPSTAPATQATPQGR